MKKTGLFFLLILLICLAPFSERPAQASGDLDEILLYRIKVDVNEDATLTMNYHIDWKVLDSDSEGPLSWVTIGIPNSHYISYRALSSTISEIYGKSSGELRIDFDREYYKGEVVSFDFELVQDYMYDMNILNEGETVYSFTPGWFDSLNVDRLELLWNSDKALQWSPSCRIVDGYCTWETSLGHGESFDVQVTYPNGAFLFDESKFHSSGDGLDGWSALILIIVLFIAALPFLVVIAAIAIGVSAYRKHARLG